MKIIEAINDIVIYPEERTIFLAGGISNCPEWQYEMYPLLDAKYRTILNPRRRDFDVGNTDENERQIYWEHRHMKLAKEILFWFPKETDCPITLFELGYWLHSRKPIYIGMDPKYSRKDDVMIQTRLIRPEIEKNIAWSLEELAENVRANKGNEYAFSDWD